MTQNDNRQFLLDLGLDPEAESLAPAKTHRKADSKPAPVVNMRLVPAKDVEFDTDRLLAPWKGDLRSHRKQVSQALFDEYSSKGNSDRNKALWARVQSVVSELIAAEEADKPKPGHVKEQMTEVDDDTLSLAKALAARGITADDIAAILAKAVAE